MAILMLSSAHLQARPPCFNPSLPHRIIFTKREHTAVWSANATKHVIRCAVCIVPVRVCTSQLLFNAFSECFTRDTTASSPQVCVFRMWKYFEVTRNAGCPVNDTLETETLASRVSIDEYPRALFPILIYILLVHRW